MQLWYLLPPEEMLEVVRILRQPLRENQRILKLDGLEFGPGMLAEMRLQELAMFTEPGAIRQEDQHWIPPQSDINNVRPKMKS